MVQKAFSCPGSRRTWGAFVLAPCLVLATGCASAGGGGAGAPSLPSPPSLPSVSPPSASPPSAGAPSLPNPSAPSNPAGSGSSPGKPASPAKPSQGTESGAKQGKQGTGQSAQTDPAGKPGAKQGTRPGAGAEEEVRAHVPPKSAATAEEKRAAVESELDKSLAEFDGMILREKETIAQRRDASLGAEGASAGGGAGGAGGGASGTSSGQGAGEAASRQAANQGSGATSGNSPNAPTGPRDASGSATGRPFEGEEEEDSSRVPNDIPSAGGDDIVARQLREAAMSEEDPVLREKLWDEYRKYKGLPPGGSPKKKE